MRRVSVCSWWWSVRPAAGKGARARAVTDDDPASRRSIAHVAGRSGPHARAGGGGWLLEVRSDRQRVER